MRLLPEPNRLGDVLKYEAPNHYSREEGVLAQGQVLSLGTVVGKRTKEEITVKAKDDNQGTGRVIEPHIGPLAQEGVYQLTAQKEDTFQLLNPQGIILSSVTVNQPYEGGLLSFTVQEGDTPFVQGDRFTLRLKGSNTLASFNPLGVDGTEKPVGVLLHDCDARAKDTKAVIITRHAIVSDKGLWWPEGISENHKQEALFHLQSRGILIRQGV